MDKKKILAITVAAVVLLGAAGAGAWFFLFRDGPAAGDAVLAAAGAADPAAGADGAGDGAAAMGVPAEPEATPEPGPDIEVDKAVYGWDYGADEAEGDGDIVDLPAGYDWDDHGDAGASDAGSPGSEPADSGSDVPADDGTDAGGGFSAPSVEGVGNPAGGISADMLLNSDTETVANPDGPADAGNQAGSGDADTAAPSESAQQAAGQKADGVKATFVKAVYSRNKKACLVRVALPDGYALADPSGYMVVAKADGNGHVPGKAVIYSCPSESGLVVYMSSSYMFSEHAALAVVPMAAYGTVDVPEDCYVELPYGSTYQASRILDGSKADFTDMMRLMFDDSATVDAWVSTRSSHVLGSVGRLGSKTAGSTALTLDTATPRPDGTAAPAQSTAPASQQESVPPRMPVDTAQPSSGTDAPGTVQGGGPVNVADLASNAGGTDGSTTVYVSSNNRIHRVSDCSGMETYREMTLSDAEGNGYERCQACW